MHRVCWSRWRLRRGHSYPRNQDSTATGPVFTAANVANHMMITVQTVTLTSGGDVWRGLRVARTLEGSTGFVVVRAWASGHVRVSYEVAVKTMERPPMRIIRRDLERIIRRDLERMRTEGSA